MVGGTGNHANLLQICIRNADWNDVCGWRAARCFNGTIAAAYASTDSITSAIAGSSARAPDNAPAGITRAIARAVAGPASIAHAITDAYDAAINDGITAASETARSRGQEGPQRRVSTDRRAL